MTNSSKLVSQNNQRFNTLYFWIYIALALIYVSIAMHLPVSIYTTAGHDDAWFINNAQNIMQGHWLGHFNQMTLIKGLGYSYFLIVNNLLGTPITFTLALLYVVSSFYLVYVLRESGIPKLVALFLFAFLIFQPALFPTRIIRDNIYFSLFLISFSGLIYAGLLKKEKYRILTIAFSGLCFGLFWITREEGIWVVPGFAFIVLYFLFTQRKENKELVLRIRLLSIYFLFSLIPPLTTALINYNMYGSFQNVDIKSSSFTKVLNTLYSVDTGQEIQFLPVSQKKREAIYKVSPSFRELKPYFENTGKGWTNPGCAFHKSTCGDYAGGWFMWALRDGTSTLGYYKDPSLASKYYERITEEVNLACNNGTLSCKINFITLMPKLTQESIQSIPKKILEAIKLTIYQIEVPLKGGPSVDSVYSLDDVSDFLGNPKIVSPIEASTLIASGWYYSQKNDWVSLKCDNYDTHSVTSINRSDSPDISLHFKDSEANKQRFTFEVADFEKCNLLFSNKNLQEIKLNDIYKKQLKFFNVNDGIVNFDILKVKEIKKDNKLDLKVELNGLYKKISIYLFSIGTLFFMAIPLFLVFFKQKPSYLVILALSLWILYYSRILLIVLVDISSFPAINHLYLLPAFPIWGIATFISIISFLSLIIPIIKVEKMSDKI